MRKTLLLFAACMLCSVMQAQSVRDAIAANKNLSGSNYLAYPSPTGQLTPAPKNYKPFYISHYGRHGSRHIIGTKEYDMVINTLSEAKDKDKLSILGKDVLERVKLLYADAYKRDGELTPLGAQQHREIATRMYDRFPEVFSGNVVVDAKSTVIIRCILSMENELQTLLLRNPHLVLKHDASYHDMYYMNQDDKELSSIRWSKDMRHVLDDFEKKHVRYKRMVNSLFNDTLYTAENVNGRQLNYNLFKIASNVQSSVLANKISLYDIFTVDELYGNWQRENASWYIGYGPSSLTAGKMPYSQRNLLRKMITEADSCVTLEHPGATLRFGHEVCVMPLACLMGLNGYDKVIDNLDSLEQHGWINYNIYPMGCNIQLVFYRSSKKDKDILVKVLLNENEATLPIKTNIAPYYRWEDVRAYYLTKLNNYKG